MQLMNIYILIKLFNSLEFEIQNLKKEKFTNLLNYFNPKGYPSKKKYYSLLSSLLTGSPLLQAFYLEVLMFWYFLNQTSFRRIISNCYNITVIYKITVFWKMTNRFNKKKKFDLQLSAIKNDQLKSNWKKFNW